MKRTPRQVRLDEETDSEVKKIAEVTGLPQIEVIRQAIRAGVHAIKENKYELPLPLKLKVVPQQGGDPFPPHRSAHMEMNEPRPRSPKKDN